MDNPHTLAAIDRAGARLILGKPARTYSEYRNQVKVAREFNLPRPVRPSFGRPAPSMLQVFSPATKDFIRDGNRPLTLA